MEKTGLFSIGQIAALFHVSVGTLRHYEKLGLVRPERVDPDSGYRYYSTAQFEVLNTIRYLRALDTPLEDIHAFVTNRQIQSIRHLLFQQEEAVRLRMEELDRIRRKIDGRLSQLEDALQSPLDEIRVQQYPAQSMALLRRNLERPALDDLELYLRELERDEAGTAVFLGKVGVGIGETALRAGALDRYQVVFLLLDPEDRYAGPVLQLEPEQCVTLRFKGSHRNAPEQYRRLLDWLNERHARITGFSKEITLIDAGFTNNPEEYVTEIRIPFA